MKTLKQVTNNILTVYTILAIGVIIVGALIDNDFLILLGAIVSVIAGLFINNIRTKFKMIRSLSFRSQLKTIIQRENSGRF